MAYDKEESQGRVTTNEWLAWLLFHWETYGWVADVWVYPNLSQRTEISYTERTSRHLSSPENSARAVLWRMPQMLASTSKTSRGKMLKAQK